MKSEHQRSPRKSALPRSDHTGPDLLSLPDTPCRGTPDRHPKRGKRARDCCNVAGRAAPAALLLWIRSGLKEKLDRLFRNSSWVSSVRETSTAPALVLAQIGRVGGGPRAMPCALHPGHE
jgi:hypothetical protein